MKVIIILENNCVILDAVTILIIVNFFKFKTSITPELKLVVKFIFGKISKYMQYYVSESSKII